MRGHAKSTKSITLSGKVYLLHYNEEIKTPAVGDVYLYLHDEEMLYLIVQSGYKAKGYKGYFKAKVFDGKNWCLLDTLDFFEDRIHQFSKTDISYYNFEVCRDRLIENAGLQVYKSYREHYTSQTHEPKEFKGKRGQR